MMNDCIEVDHRQEHKANKGNYLYDLRCRMHRHCAMCGDCFECYNFSKFKEEKPTERA